MGMEKNVQITGTAAVVVGLLLIVGIAIRVVAFSDSNDPTLEKAVRAQLWLTYGGILGTEISEIREKADYGSVPALLAKASPDAITVEKLSRSEPLMEWDSNQEVVVRVHYRFPGDTETKTEYMKFKHGPVSGWSYNYDTTAISYYLNFF